MNCIYCHNATSIEEKNIYFCNSCFVYFYPSFQMIEIIIPPYVYHNDALGYRCYHDFVRLNMSNRIIEIISGSKVLRQLPLEWIFPRTASQLYYKISSMKAFL